MQAEPASVQELEQEFLAAVRSRSGLPLADEGYIRSFWRPYLGVTPFALWDVLRSSIWYVEIKGRWPTIGLLAQMMGEGVDRHTILGRKETKTRPAQDGALDALVSEHLVAYNVTGERTGRRYSFTVRQKLPLLTPAQVGRMGNRSLQKTHRQWLEMAGIDADSWSKVAALTLVPLL